VSGRLRAASGRLLVGPAAAVVLLIVVLVELKTITALLQKNFVYGKYDIRAAASPAMLKKLLKMHF